MEQEVNPITYVDVQKEFRVCPNCGYEDGFHVSFIPWKKPDYLRVIFICPSCSARFEIPGFYIHYQENVTKK